MVDHPILFSAPMIKALLAGLKTETRRVIKPGDNSIFNGQWADSYVLDPGNEEWRQRDIRWGPDDRLWVRETWKPHSIYAHMKPREMPQTEVFYRADDAYAPSNTRWIPGIHMPRWASRLTLLVCEVRVERLQEITDEAAEREGIACRDHCWGIYDVPDEPWFASTVGPIESFSALWDALHARDGYSWDANPWVTVTRFDVIRGNIDATTPQEARDE